MHSYFLFYFQYTHFGQGLSCNNYYIMIYLTFYGSAGGCIQVEVNVGSDKIRCFCDANSIFPSPKCTIQTYHAPSSKWVIHPYNWFYKFIYDLSLYAEYLFDRSMCEHIWYNMHYTTAKVIQGFHVQDIMKMLMKGNVYWNGRIKMFWKCIHCWVLKCLIHLDW